MTREHKLALIFGFALVLVVGLLISDNFSASHKATPGGPSTAEALQQPLTSDMVALHGADTAKPVVAQAPVAPATGSGLINPENPASGNPGTMNLASNTPGGSGMGSSILEMGKRVGSTFGDAITDLGNGHTPPAGAQTEQVLHTDSPKFEAGMQPPEPTSGAPASSDGLNGPGNNTDALTGEHGKKKLPLQPHTEPSSKPSAKQYQIAEGDTFWKIAKKLYGDPSLAEALKVYNKDRIGKNGQLRVGGSLLVPEKAELKGGKSDDKTALPIPTKDKVEKLTSDKPGPGLKGAKETSAKTAKDATKPEPKAKATTYVVKAGDTLEKIAAKLLGSPSKVQALIDANKDLIDSEDEIKVGDKLTIPAR